MKITKPNEMESGILLDSAIKKFEIEFSKEDKDQSYYHIVIEGEYNRHTCDKIESIYTNAGWNNVTCKTSSERGERGGLTGLQLYKNKQTIKHKEGCEFESTIKNINSVSWNIDEGEISGFVEINLQKIHFNDGWNSYPDIIFNYCPVCGIKLF